MADNGVRFDQSGATRIDCQYVQNRSTLPTESFQSRSRLDDALRDTKGECHRSLSTNYFALNAIAALLGLVVGALIIPEQSVVI